MTFKVECAGCGEDCSNAYCTHYGYPYHAMCLPVPKRTRLTYDKNKQTIMHGDRPLHIKIDDTDLA